MIRNLHKGNSGKQLMGGFLILASAIAAGGCTVTSTKANSQNKLILENLEINGAKQWISVTEEANPQGKPVILFLHGGPGSANILLLHELVPEMEKHAIVVNWDQRGAGKSFHLLDWSDGLNVEQIVSDAHELTGFLKRKYDVDRIALMAFSSGTVFGMRLVRQFPSDYSVYISIAQMVDGKRGELLAQDFALKRARAKGDTEAVKELESIRFDFSRPDTILKDSQGIRKYLVKYGGVYHTRDGYGHEASLLWNSDEYSFFDFLVWPLGSHLSLKSMWPGIVVMNFMEEIPVVEVPVAFFNGVYDWNNPTVLAQEYYRVLNAPAGKEMVLFEKAAHAIFWDEPRRFTDEVIRIVKKNSSR